MSRRSRRLSSVVRSRRSGPYIRPSAEALLPAHESVRRFSFASGVPRQFAAQQSRLVRDLFLLSARPRPRALRRRADSYAVLRQLTLKPQALICVRRKQRREVLFARGVGGSSGRMRGKRFRRTQDSQYGC